MISSYAISAQVSCLFKHGSSFISHESELSQLKHVLIFRQMLKQMKCMLKWRYSRWLRYPFILQQLIPFFILFFIFVMRGFWRKCVCNCACSKSRKIRFFLWNWGFQVSSLQTIFARHWQRVIPAHMEGSLFLVVQLRKFFLHW
jgi:hypothetical protein